jgi:pimeloyl-ACP methyl ester carboxylesterase
MGLPDQVLFLPGASGNVDFWRPVAARLPLAGRVVRHLGWPGLGPTPADPAIRTVPDLAARVEAMLDRPTALVAQSMGGVVALLAALARPERVTHLVLAALSGGLDLARFGATDWRPRRSERAAGHPFAGDDTDLAPQLATMTVPTLLLFGDADPWSPPAAGAWLAATMPRAELHVMRGGAHTFATDTHAGEVAARIDAWSRARAEA